MALYKITLPPLFYGTILGFKIYEGWLTLDFYIHQKIHFYIT